MTRLEFLRRLEAGLKGLPRDEVDDILADYAEHFEAGLAAGRSEDAIAEALGDPVRLARELRFEAGHRNWQSARSPSSALGAIIAFVGLASLDILILLPIIAAVVGVVIALFLAVFALFVCGGAMLIIGPFTGFPGGWAVAMLAGLGVLSGSVALAAVLILVSIWIVNALMWFGRLHYRVLEPAIHSND
ncbi:DUF1700 domain-containing protein [Novosphingobium sp. 1949]|uniref:DUF1700 domain-containing protein n=1 Tax=Novosphingobium organovorum TaxID=2930092 RepID=A0ABT0BBP8_9SPHN|nr:DUF1700 domain-containing protein [Novosphingobium organovorum]MCJ2182236.1 DUF1700 domain-containing protein [Novosphingobium organovorum]